MNAEDEEEDDDREEEGMNEDSDWSEVDSVDAAPDIEHAECSNCGKDFSPSWTKIKKKGFFVSLYSYECKYFFSLLHRLYECQLTRRNY